MILGILIAVGAWLLSLFLPWWSAFLPGLIFGALLGRSGWASFGWGFAGLGGLWLIEALYIDIANHGILTSRIATLFSLPCPFMVILVTGLIGSLIGGVTALTGYLGKTTLQVPKGRNKTSYEG